jgi:anti-sigma-K factor RskA
MTPDEIVEGAALAALGALDGDDRAELDRALQQGSGRRDLEAFESVVGRLGLATDPVPPSGALKERVLAATRPVVARSGRDRLYVRLAAAAALLLAIALVVTRVERDAARRAATAARQEAEAARAQARRAQADLQAAREKLAQDAAFRALVAHPGALFVSLGPLPAAPKAHARVLFNRSSHEAVLIASGLDPAPAGKAYEVWVIGKAAPVPAGLFQVDASGRAFLRLPPVLEPAEVKTFAVTLEPALGVPAPTGPMVLAGAVS